LSARANERRQRIGEDPLSREGGAAAALLSGCYCPSHCSKALTGRQQRKRSGRAAAPEEEQQSRVRRTAAFRLRGRIATAAGEASAPARQARQVSSTAFPRSIGRGGKGGATTKDATSFPASRGEQQWPAGAGGEWDDVMACRWLLLQSAVSREHDARNPPQLGRSPASTEPGQAAAAAAWNESRLPHRAHPPGASASGQLSSRIRLLASCVGSSRPGRGGLPASWFCP